MDLITDLQKYYMDEVIQLVSSSDRCITKWSSCAVWQQKKEMAAVADIWSCERSHTQKLRKYSMDLYK